MYGILYSPLLDTEVNVKNDGVPLDVIQRPWLKNLPEQFIVKDENGDLFTTGDISLYLYIRWKYPNINLKLLNPHAISKADIASNNINFVITYNRGEAYSFDTYENFLKINDLLEHKSVYPPKQWQHLVDHKQNMYKYLVKHEVNVLPYKYYASHGPVDLDDIIDELQVYAKEHDIEKIIVRPEFGTISNDVGVFDMTELDSDEFEDYIDLIAKKYPGFIVTPFIEDFKTSGEFKVYFVGGKPFVVIKLLQTVDANDDEEEDGPDITLYDPSDPYVSKYVEYAKYVFSKLPNITLGKSIGFPLIYTRVDLVCCYKGNVFVNEIEAVPSLLGPDKLDAPFLDQAVGDQIVDVINTYENWNRREKTNVQLATNVYMWIIAIMIIVIVLMGLKFSRLKNTRSFS